MKDYNVEELEKINNSLIMEDKENYDNYDEKYEEYVYEKIKEAEENMKDNGKLYNHEEVMENLKKII